MKKLRIKDFRSRKLIKKFELKKFIIKSILLNKNFLLPVQWNALLELMDLPKKTSKTILTNRCVKTNNKKAFSKFSNYSRMVFLKLAKSGDVPYLRRSSW